MKVLAFGASTSSKSINRQLAHYAATFLPGAEVTALDLRGYTLPIYSSDEEESSGIPDDAKAFIETIKEHDAIVLSLAEHNGSYSAAFKNLYDWASRVEYAVWQSKPMVLLATSPGPGGAATVLKAAEATFPRMGAELKASFSLPSFHDQFTTESGIADAKLKDELKATVAKLAS
ncbi:NADPH-dependent FMN reductase [Pelagicoccus albus]|uniref:NAD(P)H-dependent oxidoreductase n=1 Tax=Pelagicoccus albus TaxID=415222 RepID=A0A7X1E9M7_9BACT|nr:NAD(P)H-dependent oxidoreductase [Pelagicoccus albus]MBC2607353.1 NAD(P)H-dependent oxidoreductase [Pelagicoccus albus]